MEDVIAADYDNDGDVDLYIGGRIKPGSYPLTSPGGILRNDTDKHSGKIKFTVATNEVNPELREPGMVTDAIWTDFNGDDWMDLIIVGEWMPVRIFENRNGKLFELKTEGLSKTSGLWTKILTGDFDGDGDPDYVLGNCGTNLQWKASEKEPLTLHYHDFDGNGQIDPIISSYIQGVSYPIASRDELLDQINSLRKKYAKYAQYADVTIEDIFNEEELKQAKKLEVHTLHTSYMENLGHGKFKITALPQEAQFSMVFGLLSLDYNKDGHKDILISGNFHPNRVQYGRLDASIGLLLEGNGKGDFKPIEWQNSGFFASGDIRDMASLKDKNGNEYIVIGKNNDKVQIHLLEMADKKLTLK